MISFIWFLRFFKTLQHLFELLMIFLTSTIDNYVYFDNKSHTFISVCFLIQRLKGFTLTISSLWTGTYAIQKMRNFTQRDGGSKISALFLYLRTCVAGLFCENWERLSSVRMPPVIWQGQKRISIENIMLDFLNYQLKNIFSLGVSYSLFVLDLKWLLRIIIFNSIH